MLLLSRFFSLYSSSRIKN